MVRPSCGDCPHVRSHLLDASSVAATQMGTLWGAAVVHLGLFSYWINTYTGAGSLAALGGALVLGGLPRFMRKARIHHALLMALGVILLASTRPVEGLLMCAVVAVPLCRWILFDRGRPSGSVLLIRAMPAFALLIAAGIGMGYYNYRVFGSPTTLPYTINRATYGVAPYFIWQSPGPGPIYHNEQMRKLYENEELSYYNKVHSMRSYTKASSIYTERLWYLVSIAD